MAVVTFDYDQEASANAAQGGGKPLPEGKYTLRCESFEWKQSSKVDGAPQLVTKCKILGSFNGENIGKTVTRRFWITPKALPYGLIPFLRAAGIHFNDSGRGIQFDQDHLPGAMTNVGCEHRKGDTRTFEEWQWDEPAGQAAPAPQMQQMTPQQAPQGAWAPPQAGPPQGGWSPPVQQQQVPFQPQAAMPQQQPMNGGAPPWLQGQPMQQQPGQPHVAGQGQSPPRGFGQ